MIVAEYRKTCINLVAYLLNRVAENVEVVIGLPEGRGMREIAIQKITLYERRVLAIGDDEGMIVRAYWVDDCYPIAFKKDDVEPWWPYRELLWIYLDECLKEPNTVFIMPENIEMLLEGEEGKFDDETRKQMIEKFGLQECYLRLYEEKEQQE